MANVLQRMLNNVVDKIEVDVDTVIGERKKTAKLRVLLFCSSAFLSRECIGGQGNWNANAALGFGAFGSDRESPSQAHFVTF